MTNFPVGNGGYGRQTLSNHHRHHHQHHNFHHYDIGVQDAATKVGSAAPIPQPRTPASLSHEEDGWMDAMLDNFLHPDHEAGQSRLGPNVEGANPSRALPASTVGHHPLQGCRTVHGEGCTCHPGADCLASPKDQNAEDAVPIQEERGRTINGEGCTCHPGADCFACPEDQNAEDAIPTEERESGESSLEAEARTPSVARATPGPKRSASGVSDDQEAGSGDGSEATSTALSRSERKRNREKQRRSDVNSQLASLAALLRRIEAEDLEADDEDSDGEDSDKRTTTSTEAEGCAGSSSASAVVDDNSGVSSKRRKKISVFGVAPPCPTNRVDLIARTISVLDRLHCINTERKKETRQLRREAAESKQKAAEANAKLKEAELTSDIAKQQGKVMMMMPMMVPQETTSGMGFPSFVSPGNSAFMAQAAFCQMQQQQAAAAAGPTPAVPGPGAAQPAPSSVSTPTTAAPSFSGMMPSINPASTFASPMALSATGANMFPMGMPFFAPVPQAPPAAATPTISPATQVANPLVAGHPVGVVQPTVSVGNPISQHASFVAPVQAPASQGMTSQQPQGGQQHSQAAQPPPQQQQVGSGSCGGELAHCA